MKTGVLSLPAELMALIVLVVLLLHQTCSAKDSNRDCLPSSCGHIPHISFPFRLQNDPPNCGNPRYTPSCDQDNQTVLYLLSVKHYVQDIDYTSETIRVVDSGIQKDNYSYIPGYYFDLWKDTLDSDYYRRDTENMVLLNCEKRVNSSGYLNKSTCFGNRAYASNSSSSQPEAGFRYVLYDQTKVGDVEDLCQVEHIFRTSWPSVRNLLPEDPSSISCTDLHNLLLYGFELYWGTPDCGNCGIFEFSEYRYCCKRHTGILGIPFRVYRGFRVTLRGLYDAIEHKVRLTDRGRRIDKRIKDYFYESRFNKGSLIPLTIIIIDLGCMLSRIRTYVRAKAGADRVQQVGMSSNWKWEGRFVVYVR